MKKVWDRVGIAFSSACIVHCVLVAFLPLIFPTISQFTHSSWIHIGVAFTILFTSPMAFVPGYKKHGLSWIILTAIAGLSLILGGILLEGRVTDQTSHGVSILGSLFLVFAHAKNLIHTHRHHRHHHHHAHQCC